LFTAEVGAFAATNGRSSFGGVQWERLVQNMVDEPSFEGFPKLGYPKIIHFYNFLDGIFRYKPSSYWGTPIYGNPHIEADINIHWYHLVI
jgi:hypothetical protein